MSGDADAEAAGGRIGIAGVVTQIWASCSFSVLSCCCCSPMNNPVPLVLDTTRYLLCPWNGEVFCQETVEDASASTQWL